MNLELSSEKSERLELYFYFSSAVFLSIMHCLCSRIVLDHDIMERQKCCNYLKWH